MIGINYNTLPSLKLYGCINDAKFASDFWKAQGVKPENLLILIDDIRIGRNKFPTISNVTKAIRWLFTDATVFDFWNTPEKKWPVRKDRYHYYFHYSGHGTQVKDRNGDEADGKDEAICCLNDACNYITNMTDDQLRYDIASKLPEGCLLFGIMDCCHSGTVLDLPFKFDGYSTEISGVELKKKVFIISGCQDFEVAADAFLDGVNVGATTAAFLAVMKQPGSRTYTYAQIIDKMNEYRVQHVQNNQRHVFSYCTRGDESKKFLEL